jgi:L-lactate utilization protein LutC
MGRSNVAEFHKIIARLKTALESPAPSGTPAPSSGDSSQPAPVAPPNNRAELISSFAREFEAVSGGFLGVLAPDEAARRIASLAQEAGARMVAIGEGVTTDASLFTHALEGAGCVVEKFGKLDDGERPAALERLARCDLAVAEAHYAIASTGTFAVVGAPARPNSLTLLPPISVIVVHVDRLVANVAQALAALGPDLVSAHRLSLITGPSRTADIEKRIVLGVHGPKSLYGAIIWPRNG